MQHGIDSETGEVLAPRMPPEIAGAIIEVMKKAKQLGFDEKNAHGGYSYVSIDRFLEHCGPLMADAGLMTLFDEAEVAFRDGPPGKDGRVTSWAMPRYDVWLVHKSGVMWGPLRRHLALPMTGPQTFGAAESYLQKRLFRGLFMIPTGEKDADDVAPRDDAPTGRAGATQTQERLRQHLSGANGASAPQNAARDHYRRICKEIDDATTIENLNGCGVFGLYAKAAETLIRLEQGGDAAWEKLVARDAGRRMILAGAEGDIVA